MVFWVKKLQLGQFLEKWMSFGRATEGGGRECWSQSLSVIIAVTGSTILDLNSLTMKWRRLLGARGVGSTWFCEFLRVPYLTSVPKCCKFDRWPGPRKSNRRPSYIWILSQFLLLHTYCTILVAMWVSSEMPGHLEEGLARTLMLVQVLECPTIHLFINLTNHFRAVVVVVSWLLVVIFKPPRNSGCAVVIGW